MFDLPFPIFYMGHLSNDVQLKLLSSILEEEMGRRVMKQSSDFICSPFSKSLEKVETVTGRGIFYAESSQRATRRVEVNQPWRCITLG